ncbi:MAG: chemotaxis protein CheW, partial [Polyangiales bacterium]
GGAAAVIIVLLVKSHGHERAMGVIVDAMSDVTNILRTAVKAPPSFDIGGEKVLVTGIAALENKLISILDVDRIFAS